MPEQWFQELEGFLEEKFDEFLKDNPYQDLLLKKDEHRNRYNFLIIKRKEIQASSEIKRNELIEIAENLKNWIARCKRAKQAGETDLAHQAEKHIEKLMAKGKQLWSELDAIGKSFKKVEHELYNLSRRSENEKIELDKRWSQFDAEQELNELKQKNQIKH